MPVYRRSDGERAEIWVPTDTNWNISIFLIFLGTVLVVLVPRLIETAGLEGPPWSFSGLMGFVLMAGGLLVMRFSRKRYLVGPQEVVIRDGFLNTSVRYRWEGQPSIRLRAQEEERSGKVLEYWLVNLVDGKRQYVLDKRCGHQMESRCLAEALAKAINCSVIERTDSGEMEIKREELDEPFRERARAHPALLGPEVARPENCSIELTEDAGKLRYNWRLMSPAMMSELITLVFALVLLGLVPLFPKPIPDHPDLPPERFQRSFLDMARQEGNYTYFLVTGSLVGLVSFLLIGYRKQLSAAPESLSAVDSLWGIPVWNARIPSDKLEEIWVRQSSRGAHLQFISDDCIISGRTSSMEMASWVAARIRRFYAS